MLTKLLDKYFPKVFKLEVRLFTPHSKWYYISYSNSRFSDNWESLSFWWSLGPTHRDACWSTRLMEYDDMIEFASALTSMDAVDEYYQKQTVVKEQDEKLREEWYRSVQPVKVQKIV